MKNEIEQRIERLERAVVGLARVTEQLTKILDMHQASLDALVPIDMQQQPAQPVPVSLN